MDDQQLTAVGGGANFNTLINADQTDGQGVELDFEAYLTDNFLVTLGASYNDTEIDDPGSRQSRPAAAAARSLDPIVRRRSAVRRRPPSASTATACRSRPSGSRT